MHSALKINARVLPGKRIEFTSPELVEGENVELIVLRPEAAANAISDNTSKLSLLEFVQSIPPGPRPFSSWEAYENALQEEKDAWER